MIKYWYFSSAIFLCFLGNFIILPAQSDDNGRVRLSDVINNYRLTILPVLTLDARTLYFDRKLHPDNTGGAYDEDEIWYSLRMENNVWSPPKRLPELNSKYSSVLFTLSPDGRKGLFYGIDEDSSVGYRSGFYIVSHQNGFLSRKTPLFIDDYYNLQNRFFGYLSADERTLLLSLERKDSYGELDLYVSFYEEARGAWSKPMNLGKTINTTKIEGAPFLAYDERTLYFATNGREGYGGLDLFVTRRLDESWQNWSEPVNLGKGINTRYDENSLWLSALADTVWYVSSDTAEYLPGIYFANIPEHCQPYPYLIMHGLAIMAEGANILPETAKLEIKTVSGEITRTVEFFGENKEYVTTFPTDKILSARVIANGFEDIIINTDRFSVEKPSYCKQDLFFEKSNKGGSYLIGRILFDYDSDAPSADQIRALVALIGRTNIDGGNKLIFSGHADSAGTDAYNNNLSKRRAQNTLKALKRENILIKGSSEVMWKGRTEPVSSIPAENRRVEIYILKE